MKNRMKNHLIAAAAILSLNTSITLADKPGFTAPMDVAGATTISTQQAKEFFDQGMLFIDVRRKGHRNGGEHIPNAINISTKHQLSEKTLLEVMKKEDSAVFYCHGDKCPASSKGLKKAIKWGFTNLYYYRDGINGWKDAGHPINKDPEG